MPPRESSGAVIDHMRESHHAVARMLAAGMPDHMIMSRTGYTRRRLNYMRRSPAFCQLIEDYRGTVFEKINEDTDAYAELAIGNMLASERHISDRIAALDDADELLPLRDALAIASDRADRFGYSKRVTQANINVDVAVRLDRAIERTARVVSPDLSPKQIEGHAEEAPPRTPPSHDTPQEPHAPSPAPGPSLSSALKKQYLRR